MQTLAFKVTASVKARLHAFAMRKGLSRPEVLRKALLKYVSQDDPTDEETFGYVSRDIAGSVEGPVDLSTGKEHMTGYGT
jgi:hypothetical protein